MENTPQQKQGRSIRVPEAFCARYVDPHVGPDAYRNASEFVRAAVLFFVANGNPPETL